MTHIYPPFTATEPAAELLPLFKVLECHNPQPKSKVVVSTSLYWGRGSVKNWQKKYIEPLLNGCEQSLPEDWSRRIYLSFDLAGMVRKIPRHVEVNLMDSMSWGSIPGMLWRYLPITEDVFCFARGADNWTLQQWEIDAVQQAVASQAQLYRHVWNPAYINAGVHWLYRTIRGTCGIQGPLPFLEAATQWIAYNREQQPPQMVEGKPHFGLGNWQAFGQDEQFLCRWLYYIMASKKTLTRVSPVIQSDIFRQDMEYLESQGGTHVLLP